MPADPEGFLQQSLTHWRSLPALLPKSSQPVLGTNFPDEPQWPAEKRPESTDEMTGSSGTLQNELPGSSESTRLERTDWERKLFYLLTPALMGDPTNFDLTNLRLRHGYRYIRMVDGR